MNKKIGPISHGANKAFASGHSLFLAGFLRSTGAQILLAFILALLLVQCSEEYSDVDEPYNLYSYFLITDSQNFCRLTTNYTRANPGDSFSGLTDYRCFLFQNDSSLTIQMTTAPNSGEYRAWVDYYYISGSGQDSFRSISSAYQEAWVYTACPTCPSYSVDF
tara:strand:+ start:17696 stop:18184 length:489 start_codon:yes stop_codon:yes gene_type:complete